jgi:hypothetical protein
MKISEVIAGAGKPAKASLVKIGNGSLYHVIGASGHPAGWLERVRDGWALTLKASPTEVFRQFRDARAEALHSGQRY